MIDFASFDDVLGFLVYLIADRFRIVAGCCNKEIQRLHSGIAGAFCHDIKQLSVRLGMQFIEHHTMRVESVLVTDIGGKHLIDTARWLINDPLLGIEYLDPFGKCRTHSHHVGGHIENDGCLLSVSGTAVNLGSFFTVTAGKQKCYSGSQF